jgi:hypothetical protein
VSSWWWDDENIATLAAFMAAAPNAQLDLTLWGAEEAPGPLLDAGVARRLRVLRLEKPDLAILRSVRAALAGVDTLELDSVPWSLQLAGELEAASRLSRLILHDAIANPEVLARLAGAPLASTIRSLTLQLCGDAVAGALARAAFPEVRTLALKWWDRADDDFAEVDAAFPRVEELIISPFDLLSLGDSPLATRIRTLTLVSAFGPLRLDLFDLRALDQFAALDRLRLAGPLLTSPEVIDALAALPVPIEILPNLPRVTAM